MIRTTMDNLRLIAYMCIQLMRGENGKDTKEFF